MLQSDANNGRGSGNSASFLEPSRQKVLGSFYTPPDIAHYIANRCIKEALTSQIFPRFLDTNSSPAIELNPLNIEEVFANLPHSLLKKISDEILPTLRICDPSCGNGAFLIAAAEIITKIYHNVSYRRR